MGFFSKIGAGLKKTRDSIMNSVNSMLHSFTKIDDELFEELEEILIMADAGASTSARICELVRGKVKERGETDPAKIKDLLAETVAELLRGGQELNLRTKPSVILVIGKGRRSSSARRTPSAPPPSSSWRSGPAAPVWSWSSIPRAPTRRRWFSIPWPPPEHGGPTW